MLFRSSTLHINPGVPDERRTFGEYPRLCRDESFSAQIAVMTYISKSHQILNLATCPLPDSVAGLTQLIRHSGVRDEPSPEDSDSSSSGSSLTSGLTGDTLGDSEDISE